MFCDILELISTVEEPKSHFCPGSPLDGRPLWFNWAACRKKQDFS